jgi:hypothetical protein
MEKAGKNKLHSLSFFSTTYGLEQCFSTGGPWATAEQ